MLEKNIFSYKVTFPAVLQILYVILTVVVFIYAIDRDLRLKEYAEHNLCFEKIKENHYAVCSCIQQDKYNFTYPNIITTLGNATKKNEGVK